MSFQEQANGMEIEDFHHLSSVERATAEEPGAVYNS